MAKIVAEFDTISKEMSVSMDGDLMENVESVEMFRSFYDDNTFHVSINKVEKNQDNDTVTVTRIMADKNNSSPKQVNKEVTKQVYRDIAKRYK